MQYGWRDSVAATNGIDKIKAINVSRHGHALDKLGRSSADLVDVVKQASKYMAAWYGYKAPCSSMTECRQQMWAQQIGKPTAASKLCGLPPTTEASQENVYRAHFQVAQWYSALIGDPLPLNAVDYGWEAGATNKCLIPRNISEGVRYAPEHILQLIKCGCSSQRPSKKGNCGCMRNPLPCTMFFACGGHSCFDPSTHRPMLTMIWNTMYKMYAL